MTSPSCEVQIDPKFACGRGVVYPAAPNEQGRYRVHFNFLSEEKTMKQGR